MLVEEEVQRIKTIEAPNWSSYTGFAGGINEDNVDRICSTISLNPIEKEVWIDLESGARTNDKFDLEKVYRILSKCEKYI